MCLSHVHRGWRTRDSLYLDLLESNLVGHRNRFPIPIPDDDVMVDLGNDCQVEVDVKVTLGVHDDDGHEAFDDKHEWGDIIHLSNILLIRTVFVIR